MADRLNITPPPSSPPGAVLPQMRLTNPKPATQATGPVAPFNQGLGGLT